MPSDLLIIFIMDITMLISVLLTFVWHLWQCHHSYAFFAVNTDLQRRRESDHSYEIGLGVGALDPHRPGPMSM